MSELLDIDQKVIIGPDGLPLTPTGQVPVTEEDRQQLQLSQGAPLEYDMDRLMALPPKDTFLFRFLVAVLRNYYKKPDYQLNHQEQVYGTYVGQASKKACDILMALYSMIYGVKFPGRSSVAGAYTFSRVEVAGQPGRWEGSNGYWSAAGLIRFGILLLKDLDLDEEATDADEQLAMKWVASKQGVPSNFENKAENQMVQGTIPPENVKHAAKLIQVGLPQFVGTTYLPTGKCDARGVSPCKRTRGGHEMCLDSVIWNGDEPAFFLQHQSWFTGWASGPKMVPDQPAEAVWISARDYGIQLQDGDANAIYGVNGLNYDL